MRDTKWEKEKKKKKKKLCSCGSNGHTNEREYIHPKKMKENTIEYLTIFITLAAYIES